MTGPTRRITSFDVLPIGLGCMGLSHGYGQPATRAQAERLLLGALDAGVNLIDTAALYGFGRNEALLGEILAPHRQRFVLASKCGIFRDENGKRQVDGRPETLRRTCEDALRRLRTDVIDLYYLHRWDKSVPLADSVGALADLVRAGKVRTIGLCEVSAASLRAAHAVHPIAAVQSEYSLWSRDVEIAVLDACREIGAALVAFAPLGRAFFTATLDDVAALAPSDLRRGLPRFQPEAYARNQALLQTLRQEAEALSCTPAQLALAWLLQRGEHVIAIPGTTRLAHLQENLGALDVHVDAARAQRLAAAFSLQQVSGARHTAARLQELDTESRA